MAEQANVSLNISDYARYWPSDYDLYWPSDHDVYWSSDDGIRRRQLISFIIKALILGVIIVVGIIGNCLTFVVFWKGNFKSSTSFLFLSLSLIDSAFLITVFPLQSVSAFVAYTGWLQGYSSVEPFLIVYGTFPVSTTKTATIWVTVLVAVNRYIIVCRPLRASQWCTISKVKIQLAVVLVLAVVGNIPQLFKCRIKYYAQNNGTSFAIDIDYGVKYRWNVFYTVYDIIVVHVLWTGVPLFILTVLTIRLIKAMKAHRRMQLDMNNLYNQQDSNMTFALVMVVIVFIICHVPSVFLWMKSNVVPIEVLIYSDVLDSVCDIANFLIILNSSINFAIYILANKRFREVLTNTICRRHIPTKRRVVAARQMARAEVVRGEPDDVNDTPL